VPIESRPRSRARPSASGPPTTSIVSSTIAFSVKPSNVIIMRPMIPRERSAVDDEQRQHTVCLCIPLDDATEPVRLRELPSVLGLLNVSDAKTLADSRRESRTDSRPPCRAS
jgi:hypothetical protein